MSNLSYIQNEQNYYRAEENSIQLTTQDSSKVQSAINNQVINFYFDFQNLVKQVINQPIIKKREENSIFKRTIEEMNNQQYIDREIQIQQQKQETKQKLELPKTQKIKKQTTKEMKLKIIKKKIEKQITKKKINLLKINKETHSETIQQMNDTSNFSNMNQSLIDSLSKPIQIPLSNQFYSNVSHHQSDLYFPKPQNPLAKNMLPSNLYPQQMSQSSNIKPFPNLLNRQFNNSPSILNMPRVGNYQQTPISHTFGIPTSPNIMRFQNFMYGTQPKPNNFSSHPYFAQLNFNPNILNPMNIQNQVAQLIQEQKYHIQNLHKDHTQSMEKNSYMNHRNESSQMMQIQHRNSFI